MQTGSEHSWFTGLVGSSLAPPSFSFSNYSSASSFSPSPFPTSPSTSTTFSAIETQPFATLTPTPSSSSLNPEVKAPEANGTEEKPKLLMRPPKVTIISEHSYRTQYWPNICASVKLILADSSAMNFSQEELIRTVYNVCCQRHSNSLSNDLMDIITNHLSEVQNKLLSSLASPNFILYLTESFIKFSKSIDIIVIIFKHLDSHIVQKTGDTLAVVLKTLLNKMLMENPPIYQALSQSLCNLPSHFDPALKCSLVKTLYSLNKEYAEINKELFSLYIPCLLPSKGIDHDTQDTLKIILTLKRDQQEKRFIPSTHALSRKRKWSQSMTAA